jgi:transcriptional regulator with XRE-family HTH domain
MSSEKITTGICLDAEQSLVQKIKALRDTRRLKQIDLAEFCGVTQVSVSKWEKSRKPAIPSAKNLLRLAELVPEEERPWWRARASERVGFEVQGLQAVSPSPTGRKKSERVDAKLLAQVLEAVERAMNKAGGYFSTKIRADVLAWAYDSWRENGHLEASQIEAKVQEARSPSNRKVRT